MIVTAIQCEICDETYKLADKQNMPPGWIVLTRAFEEDLHFCSKECLAQWVAPNARPQEQHAPQSTMRRFMFINGETADEVEGVKWSNGCVSLDPEHTRLNDLWFYRSWEEFGNAHPGDGVTWIDQEVKADANSN